MSAAGAMSVDVNSGRAFTINGQGKVGIGGAPTNQFSIVEGTGANLEMGSNSTSTFIQSYNRASSAWQDLVFLTSSETMRLTSTGKVGIGLTNPSWQLEVQNTGTVRNAIASTTNGTAGVFFRVFNSGTQVGNGTIRTDNTGNMSFFTGTSGESEQMRITSSGVVCIGTTSSAPSAQLTIGLNDSVGGRLSLSNLRTALFDGDEFGRLSFVSNDGTQTGDRARISALCRNTGAATDLVFYTGNTSASVADRMRITSDGNINIANTSTNGLILYGDSAGGIIYSFRDANSPGSMFRWYTGGNQVGSISTTTSSTSFNTSSDYRLKEDLQDFAGLDLISKIPVYDFKWKTDKSRSYGVLAHELAEILPNAVDGEKDAVNEDGTNELQGVDYSKIVPLLVKSIQELKAEIETLKTQINN